MPIYNIDSSSFFFDRWQNPELSIILLTLPFFVASPAMLLVHEEIGPLASFDVPRLRKYGHREANHNRMSAMMKVLYVYGGKEGDVCRRCCCKPSHAGSHD
jgi:hypothetical protein